MTYGRFHDTIVLPSQRTMIVKSWRSSFGTRFSKCSWKKRKSRKITKVAEKLCVKTFGCVIKGSKALHRALLADSEGFGLWG